MSNQPMIITPLVLGSKASSEHLMQLLAPAGKLLDSQAEFAQPVQITIEDAGTLLGPRIGKCDAIAIAAPLTVPDYAPIIAGLGKPVMLLEPFCAFHPYQATARTALEREDAVVLPTDSPEAIVASVQAMAARRDLLSSTALFFVAEPEKHADLARAAHARLGVKVEIRDVDELKQETRRTSEAAAVDTLAGWKENKISRIVDVTDKHLVEVARLYHAEKNLLKRHNAAALGVEEFSPFLFQKLPMPNATYALLKDEGIVCTEEADLGCLLTQLVWKIATGLQNTMSNIYMAYRSEFENKPDGAEYTHEMELADYRECLRDNCVVVSHFSTAGSLPRNMMAEDKWEIRETKGAWPGQSMVYSTPRRGPVTLTRFSDSFQELDAYPGVVADVRKHDHLHWYTCRWMVRLASARRFVETAINHHYAIAPGHPDAVLRTLASKLLGVRIREY